MNMPPMIPSNTLAVIMRRIAVLERELTELRSATGTLSFATIYKGGLKILSGGGVTLQEGGSVVVEDGGGIVVTDGGFITAAGSTIRATDPDTGATVAYFGALATPYRSGLLAADQSGDTIFWAAENTDGGTSVGIDTDVVQIVTPSLQLYELSTTGLAANLTLDVVAGVPIVKWSVSSERYKMDIAPVEVDVAEVLELTGITWVHNDNMESAVEGDIRRNVGWHAEQLDSKPSLRQFVNYDDEGLPDSVEDSRMAVPVLEVCKAQQKQLDQQDKTIADLTARLETLEAR